MSDPEAYLEIVDPRDDLSRTSDGPDTLRHAYCRLSFRLKHDRGVIGILAARLPGPLLQTAILIDPSRMDDDRILATRLEVGVFHQALRRSGCSAPFLPLRHIDVQHFTDNRADMIKKAENLGIKQRVIWFDEDHP